MLNKATRQRVEFDIWVTHGVLPPVRVHEMKTLDDHLPHRVLDGLIALRLNDIAHDIECLEKLHAKSQGTSGKPSSDNPGLHSDLPTEASSLSSGETQQPPGTPVDDGRHHHPVGSHGCTTTLPTH